MKKDRSNRTGLGYVLALRYPISSLYCSSCNSGAVEIASRPAEPSGAGFVSGSRRSDSAILILSEETDESFFPTSPYPGPFRAGAERSSGPRRKGPGYGDVGKKDSSVSSLK